MASSCGLQVVALEAGLGRVGVHVDLQIDGQPASAAAAGFGIREAGEPIETGRQLERVDRFDDIEELDGAGGLVGLQVSHEMPFGRRYLAHLVGRFLDSVLPESVVAGQHREAEPVGRDRLGDGHQLGVPGCARRAGAGGRHALEDLLARRDQPGEDGDVRVLEDARVAPPSV